MTRRQPSANLRDSRAVAKWITDDENDRGETGRRVIGVMSDVDRVADSDTTASRGRGSERHESEVSGVDEVRWHIDSVGEDGRLRSHDGLIAARAEASLHSKEQKCCPPCGFSGSLRTTCHGSIPKDRARWCRIDVGDDDLSRGIADIDAGNEVHSSRFRA